MARIQAKSVSLLPVVVRIALVGDENDSYPSHRALNVARGLLGDDVQAGWVPTDAPQVHDLTGFDGIWLVPGSPYADDAAAYAAVTWARQHDVPFLGTCGGLQYAVIEYFRNVLGVPGASHAESDGVSGSNVISALACRLQGQERVVRPVPGTRFDRLVGGESLAGMHYCTYGPGPDQLARLVAGGMLIEATADDADAEVLELPANRFFMLTLFQPQIGAQSGRPLHPLLQEFVRCARAHGEQAA
jgi:CTP synthase (UTP-ammonia lyase)